MEERIVVKGKTISWSKKILIVITICLLIYALFVLIAEPIVKKNSLEKQQEAMAYDGAQEFKGRLITQYSEDAKRLELREEASKSIDTWHIVEKMRLNGWVPKTWFFIIIFCVAAIPLLVYLYLSKMEIVVTDKRVYGRTAFGRRVDLPLDSIAAVATGAFHGIGVSTSSGRIMFLGIKNNKDIHDELSKLLIDRQKPANGTPVIEPEIQQSNADELRKYKDLLDGGVITQEEFDAKKKQLLGLD